MLFALVLAAAPAVAQEDAVRTAERLRDTGDFRAAVRVLRAYLSAQPDDGEAARLLAQTLYWAQDVDGARRVYEDALVRHPQDHQLRLDYSRMLAETGDGARARALLEPLRDVPDAAARACALLGTLAYWEGDLTTAASLFTTALALDPSLTEADRQRREIRAASAPWVRAAPVFWSDDQPLDWWGAELEGGWFPTPLTPVRVHVQPRQYRLEGRTSTVWLMEGNVRHYAPRLHLDTELGGGVVRRTLDDEPSLEWTARAVAAIRLPRHMKILGRLERIPYLNTIASLDTSILVDGAAVELHWADPRGWLAAAALERQRYPDDNALHTGYGWILAPIARRPGVDLRLGYAFSADDADESRFVPVDPPTGNVPPGSVVYLEGRYDPYYTPQRLVKHSAVGAVTSRISPRATLRVGGSVAVRATEEAPVLVQTPLGVERVFEDRRFTPWDLRASIEVAVGEDVAMGVSAETGRGAFYEWARAGVQLTYRFTPAAGRLPEGR